MATMFSNGTKKPAAPEPMTASKPAPRTEPAPATEEPSKKTLNIIGQGTIIEGNILADGDLVVEGIVRGDVTTKTKLVVGAGSVIEGNILADHAEVAGHIRGTVQASGLLIIKSSSVIDGDVITKNLNVESGSTFHGRFQVGGKVESVAKPVDAVKKDAAAPAVKI
jgi:cytoskeletal protein CcmA (bactofilin family)